MSENLYTKGYPHVPYPRGAHSVSAADLCTGGNDSVLIRLFYPTPEKEISAVKTPDQWATWYLGDQHNDGFVQFITSSATYSRFILPALKPFLHLYGYFLTRNIKVPVEWCQELLPRGTGGSSNDGREGGGGGGEGWPLVLISHGMANHRSTFSTLSCDLASHGFVVAAIEHREGSASASFHVNPETKEKMWIKYTAYGHNKQFDSRIDDIFHTVSALRRLNDGEVENLLKGESPLPIDTFRNCLDLSNLIVIGHSYGGAAVLKALADRRNRFSCGVVLDPWMFPVRTSVKELGQSISIPVLSISTEHFNSGPNKRVLQGLQEAHSNPHSSFITMADTSHHHGNDAPWISGRFGWWVTGGTYAHHPYTIHKLQCSLILAFIDKHIDTARDELYGSDTWLPQYLKFIDGNDHIIITNGDKHGV